MDLQPLFKAQAELDKLIIKEKGLEGKDLLDKKVLALQVELGELANEFRGFKFWSENQEPRTYGFYDNKDCEYCNGTGTIREHPSDTGYSCPDCEGSGFMHYNPLLEEYVDVLHFILSIGNDLELQVTNPAFSSLVTHQIEKQFNLLFHNISKLSQLNNRSSRADEELIYSSIFDDFLGLGEMLGFTWNQIEQAYYQKNEINHERQANGY